MKRRYCSHCGRQLIRKIVNASNFIKRFPCLTYDAFDSKTGKENLMVNYKCPKYSSFFGSKHDSYGKKLKEIKK
jgi:hypothetical protein